MATTAGILVVCFLALASVCCAASGSDQAFLARVARHAVSTRFTEPNCPDPAAGQRLCDSCTSFKICVAGGGNPLKLKCPKETPYCVNGKCEIEQSDASCTSQFQCTSEGYMPDPQDCSKFHYCGRALATDPLTATTYTCPKDRVYDPPSLLCKIKKTPADCALMICNKSLQSVSYAPNKAYYAYCDGENALVYKCPDTVYQKFDETLFDCVFTCPKEGIFAEPSDEHKYITCYANNAKFESKIETCPPGLKFKAEQLLCAK